MQNKIIPPAPRPRALGDIPFKPLDAGWRQWIAENRLRHCTPESMLVTMGNAGLDPAECAPAIRRMESDPAFLAARKMQQLQRKLESVMANQQKLWEMAPGYAQVEKRSRVSREEFIARYVCGGSYFVWDDLAPGRNEIEIGINANAYLWQSGHRLRLQLENLQIHQPPLGDSLRFGPYVTPFEVRVHSAPAQLSWIDVPVR